MSDTAVRLVERVIPEVPVRQSVCSLPWRLRALCGYDRRLCAAVLEAFVLELSRSLKRRAKQSLGLATVAQAHTGAVSVIQRGDSSLRLNVHYHVLALDGVYVREAPDTPLVFHALPEPSAEDVAEVAETTALRVQKIIPARPREPKDKAKVEAGVWLAQRWILACIRNLTFFSLDELNDVIAVLLERLNTRPFQKLPTADAS